MSSPTSPSDPSAGATSGPPPKLKRAVTLRTKLIASIVGLIVLISIVIGVTTEIALSRYLLAQLDQQVTSSAGRFGRPPNGTQSPGNGEASAPTSGASPVSDLNRGGTRLGTLRATVSDGKITSCRELEQPPTASTATSVGFREPTVKQLSAAECAPLLAVVQGAKPVTVTIESAGYRVAAFADGTASGTTQIVGLPAQDVEDVQRRLALIMALVAGAAIILGGLIVFVVVRRSVRPLERVAAIARKVATLPLDKGEVDLAIRVPLQDTDSRTEIGSVGAAINQMLGHVSGALSARHASETRVRQFVADASHELRTPLAAIRGYAELARRGEHEPGAVAHALRRVESETGRMTTLVEDLLLLARLDSGRPLASEEVDMTMLVVDRVSDARVAGTDHRWQLDLPDEPVTVIGDSARLHQVLANLLANARNHTPPGTVVVTGVRREPGGVVMTVTDDGPGIPAELQPEIFGRFVRGDSSRSRAAGSTGLGLAIVAAVIAAHGGTVTVESRPGRTCARVWLPDNVDLPVAPFDTLPATSGLPTASNNA